MSTPIKNLRDPEIFLGLKKTCQYIVDEPWQTSGDFELDYAIAKTKKHEDDVRALATLDTSLAWGQLKYESSPSFWVTKQEGDFNPWYKGDLTLEALIESFETFIDILDNQTPRYMPEVEFIHYYYFLRTKLPKPTEAVKALPATITFNSLHPKIQEHCRSRFNSKHYADAILAAYKVVLNEIKDITGIRNLDGKQLIERALSLTNPIIKLNPLVTQSDKDEQQGFMLLFSGAAVGIRNPKAHDLVMQEDKQKALSYLAFASLLMQRLDERLEPPRRSDTIT